MSFQEIYDVPDFLKEKMYVKRSRRGGCRDGECDRMPDAPRPPHPCRDGECDRMPDAPRPPHPCRDGECDRMPDAPRPPHSCWDGQCYRPSMRAFSVDEGDSHRAPCPQYAYHPCLMGDLCSTPVGKEPLPFYQVYSDTLQMQEVTEDERDLERLKDMYPERAKKLQMLVDEQVDKMDHDGSMMFDVAPDKEQITQIVGEISQQFASRMGKNCQEQEHMFEGECDDKDEMEVFHDNTVDDLIRVLLYHEMYRRRCQRRRCKRWW